MHFQIELPNSNDEVIKFNDSNITLDENGIFDIGGLDIDGYWHEENRKKFGGKKLIFTNCTGLKKIEADALGLRGIEIIDCEKLERISASNNRLEELDLSISNSKELVYLNVSANNLKTLKIKNCDNLETLKCQNNKLKKLDLSDNNKLEDLDCSFNEIERFFLQWLLFDRFELQ
ncbi:MAG: hypothetical protein mread185_000475 [Mycoplasmataceae bacterium]|nr:MAG: hypothetical protein mread185_000475 [Mycoplasmataceae bacterium]